MNGLSNSDAWCHESKSKERVLWEATKNVLVDHTSLKRASESEFKTHSRKEGKVLGPILLQRKNDQAYAHFSMLLH